jgi:hypothetical protein
MNPRTRALTMASALLLASLASACVSESSDSCQVVPNYNSDQPRINVNGTNAGSACQSIASHLGLGVVGGGGVGDGGWNVQDQASLPSDDARHLCSGTIGGATYVVWGHIRVYGTGYVACQTLGGYVHRRESIPT